MNKDNFFYPVIIICLFLLFSACGPSYEEIKFREKQTSDSLTAINQYNAQLISTEGDDNSPPPTISYYSNHSKYVILFYSINNCEYICFQDGDKTWGSHSGTCPNSIHKNSTINIQNFDTIPNINTGYRSRK